MLLACIWVCWGFISWRVGGRSTKQRVGLRPLSPRRRCCFDGCSRQISLPRYSTASTYLHARKNSERATRHLAPRTLPSTHVSGFWYNHRFPRSQREIDERVSEKERCWGGGVRLRENEKSQDSVVFLPLMGRSGAGAKTGRRVYSCWGHSESRLQ